MIIVVQRALRSDGKMALSLLIFLTLLLDLAMTVLLDLANSLLLDRPRDLRLLSTLVGLMAEWGCIMSILAWIFILTIWMLRWCYLSFWEVE